MIKFVRYRLRLRPASTTLCLLLWNLCCQADEATNFIARLDLIPPFPAVQAAAKAMGIPLDGVDALAGTNAPNPGDSATTLVTLHEKGRRRTQWLISFRATNDSTVSLTSQTNPTILYTSTGYKFEFAHSPGTIRLRTIGPFTEPASGHDQPKLKDKSAVITVNQSFLGLGLDKAIAALHRLHILRANKKVKLDFNFGISSEAFTKEQISKGKEMASLLEITPEEERALAGGVPALFSYFETVQQTPNLDTIMFKVLSLPSVWTLVKNLGITPGISIGHPEDRVGPLTLSNWNLPAGLQLFSLPVEVALNNHHALTLTLIVTSPRPPFLVCGGIVGFLAENPDDKENYLTLQVISAHCAAEQSETKPQQPDTAHSH